MQGVLFVIFYPLTNQLIFLVLLHYHYFISPIIDLETCMEMANSKYPEDVVVRSLAPEGGSIHLENQTRTAHFQIPVL